MLDPKQLKAIRKSAQREEWSSIGDAVGALSAQASGNPIDIIRIKSLIPVIQQKNREDLLWAIDELLRIQKRSGSK